MKIPKNLPNALTVLRIFMVGIFVWLFRAGHTYWSLFVFLLAGLTDILDGWLSRKFDLVSDFGKLMDPLADKLMTVALIACFYLKGYIDIVILIILAVKELLMIIGALVMLKKNVVVKSNIFGKLATFLTIAALTLTFFHEHIYPWDTIVLYVATAVSLFAMIMYFREYYMQKSGRENA